MEIKEFVSALSDSMYVIESKSEAIGLYFQVRNILLEMENHFFKGKHDKVAKLETKFRKIIGKLDTLVVINLVELIRNDLSTRVLISLSVTSPTDEELNVEIGLFKSRERKLAVVRAILDKADPHAALLDLEEEDSLVN